MRSVTRASGFWLLALCAALACAQGNGPPSWEDVDLVTKNFTGNLYLTDRDYKIALIPRYPNLEYPSNPPIRGVAYRRGQNATLVWTLKNENDFRLIGNLNLLEARLRCPGPNTETPPGSGNWHNPDVFLGVSVAPNSVPIDLPAHGSQNVTLTFTGLPAHVALGDLEVKYDLTLTPEDGDPLGENGTRGSFEKFTRVFIVDSLPAGLQTIPWADFLEYTCRWGWGAVGFADLKTTMARGMHYSNRSTQARLEYRPNDIWFCEPVSGSYPGTIRYYLGDLTRSLDAHQWTQMDCKDFAAGLKLAFASHGVGSDVVWLQRDDGTLIVTNPLCKAGTDASVGANYFVYFEFTHHAIVESAFTYDPAAAYFWDPNGSLYMDPATEWTIDPHWQNPVGNVYRGLVSEYAPPLLPRPLLPIVELKAD